MIAKKEGLRGFYVGGLMTSAHDGVSSGIFFATCAWLFLLFDPKDDSTDYENWVTRFRLSKTATG